jgi:hypothetical protein
VTVTLKGDNLVLSGTRRNEEKVELSPGHTQGTASYQSYSESFPLPFPVEARQLSKTFDGDMLIATIPKKNQYAFEKPAKPVPQRLKAERPKLPDNLPQSEARADMSLDEKPPGSSRGKSKGTQTLA